ncbi:hypothetical protein [Bacteroides congonensis]
MVKYDPEIIELRIAVEKHIERKMRTPADFDFLVELIWEQVREPISPTTLKRLWGYIKGSEHTRPSTLDILSQFVGKRNWDDFLLYISEKKEEQSTFIIGYEIKSEDLSLGDKVVVTWCPNRCCMFVYLGNSQFEVIESRNSKLNIGDTFYCLCFAEGHPLYINSLVQVNSASSVSYVAGMRNGLVRVQVVSMS